MKNLEKKYILKYNKPAPDTANGWRRHSIPIGNGYSGANIFGRVDKERIQISEESFWSGGPIDAHSDDVHGSYIGNSARAHGNTGRISDDIATGTANEITKPEIYKKAQLNSLGKTGQTIADGPPDPYAIGSTTGVLKGILPTNKDGLGRFQNFAELYLHLLHDGKTITEKDCTDYWRTLDLKTAVSTVNYQYQGVNYTREYFTSYPARIQVVKISADARGKISLILNPTIPHEFILDNMPDYEKCNYGKNVKITAANDKKIEITGYHRQNGLKFAASFQLILTGGQTCVTRVGKADATQVIDADSVVILISLGTNYSSDYDALYRCGADVLEVVNGRLESAVEKGFERLKDEHIADYQAIFNRVNLDLGGCETEATTDEQLREYRGQDSRYFEELYFQYGRYLLISSSRPGTLPANLQGVWNMYLVPPWQSDYHLNINLQMNYWLANNANMKECLFALLDYIDGLRKPGRVTARAVYGVGVGCDINEETGWVAHVSANIFGYTGLINPHNMEKDHTGHAHYAPESAAWIMQNVYNLYQYYPDENLLRERIYPMLKETALFFSHPNVLVDDPVSGRKVMAPSYSSEHGPMWAGATFGQQLLWQLFTDTIEAAEILENDVDFSNKLTELRASLSDPGEAGPVPIGDVSGRSGGVGTIIGRGNAKGVKEWWWEVGYYKTAPYKTASPMAKHQADAVLGIIPNTEDEHRHLSHLVGLFPGKLITKETPEWMEAAINSLNIRGDAATGWSRGKKINLWARTGDGDRAYKIFKGLINEATFENLWDFHTGSPSEGMPDDGIFQIDGNLGGAAGMIEMLLQSHAGYIEPLPALPQNWVSGSVSGLTARGGFVVDMAWDDHALTTLTITSTVGGNCRIKLNESAEILEFETKVGASYQIL